ncbi:MAG: hypothetical protein MMC23_000528 [Stictis urceolatum]|nr:hypothetical protein [Stictis urceolata]
MQQKSSLPSLHGDKELESSTQIDDVALSYPDDEETALEKEQDPNNDLQSNLELPHDTDGASLKRVKTRPAMSLAREIAFIIVCCCGQLFTQAGLGQSIPIEHVIGQDSFGNPNPGELSWFAAGYSLTVGTFILVAGRVGDIVGHKPVYVFGWAWYALWSLIAGFSAFSHNAIFFDFCRALQGIGPAVLLPCSLALLGRTYPPGRRKEMIFAVYGATAPNGFLLGAVFSGLVAELLWWPWAYWLMGIVCLILAVGSFVIIPDPEDDGDSAGPQTFDWWGSITGVAGLVLFNVAWNQAPIVGWQRPEIIALLILGVLSFVAFAIVERRVKQPLVPIDGLQGQSGFVLGCIGLGWSSFGIWVYYEWQFLGELRHYSPLGITAQTAPVGISGIVAALTTGFMLSRVQPGFIMAVAMCCFCAGNILFATMPVDQTYWFQTFLANIITPWGMDMSFPCGTLILSNFVGKRHQGIAASLVATVVNYSISIGLGIGGTVEVHVNENNTNLLRGYRGAWYAGISLSVLGILLSIYFIVYGLRKGGIRPPKQ